MIAGVNLKIGGADLNQASAAQTFENSASIFSSAKARQMFAVAKKRRAVTPSRSIGFSVRLLQDETIHDPAVLLSRV
jgi:hypothetical protein